MALGPQLGNHQLRWVGDGWLLPKRLKNLGRSLAAVCAPLSDPLCCPGRVVAVPVPVPAPNPEEDAMSAVNMM